MVKLRVSGFKRFPPQNTQTENHYTEILKYGFSTPHRKSFSSFQGNFVSLKPK
jgi:hypothetical protein